MSRKPSLTEKYLPQEVWKWLQLRTSYGTTIGDCVKSVIDEQRHHIEDLERFIRS